jgi:hypothetical protein
MEIHVPHDMQAKEFEQSLPAFYQYLATMDPPACDVLEQRLWQEETRMLLIVHKRQNLLLMIVVGQTGSLAGFLFACLLCIIIHVLVQNCIFDH